MDERVESVLDNLEPGIVMDILSRLPIHSLFQCRRVCRNWRQIIRSREFIMNHFTRSFLTHDCKRKMINEPDNSFIACVREHPLDATNMYFVQLGMPRDTIIINCHFDTLGPYKGQFKVVGSCNGLLCIDYGTPINPYFVCNPITQERMKLPNNTHISKGGVTNYGGFVFDGATGEYKVVSIFPVSSSQHQWRVEYKTYMLTLGTTSWEYVGNIPAAPYKLSPHSCVLVNGALHWRTPPQDGSGVYIMAFDIASKEFSVVPPPPIYQVLYSNYWILCNLEGHLAVITIDNTRVHVVWEMTEYKVESSWHKTQVPEWHRGPFNVGLLPESLHPSSQYDELEFPWKPTSFTISKHVGSLISLSDAIKLHKKDKKKEAGCDRKCSGTKHFIS